MSNAIAFHPLGVTYNGLHSTTTPTTLQVRGDVTLTKAHWVASPGMTICTQWRRWTLLQDESRRSV